METVRVNLGPRGYDIAITRGDAPGVGPFVRRALPQTTTALVVCDANAQAHGRAVEASLAATTGVHTSADALKLLLAGADVVMMASALLHDGPEHVAVVLREIQAWMTERDYASVTQLRGSMSQANIPNPVAFARANYAQLVTSFVSPYDWRMSTGEPHA